MPEAARTGPPSKLTEQRIKAICWARSKGLSVAECAEKADVHRDTVYGWLERSQVIRKRVDAGDEELSDEERLLLEFARRYARARRGRKLKYLKRVENAKTPHEAAVAQWLLEVFAPEEFGRGKQMIEHSGSVNVTVDATALAARIAALSTAGAAASTGGEASGGAADALAGGASSDRGGGRE